MVELSVVVPVYGCEECLRELHARLGAALEAVTDSYELVFVEDRGADGSWELLTELSRADGHVRAFRLSRNFGQHAAITAGLAQCNGRWAVVMDCDLQDPPEEIPRLYAKAQEGYDVVLTTRARRAQSPLRRLAGRSYIRVRNAFLGTDVDTEHSTLSIISRKVVEAFLSVRDRDRQYLLILYWLGFPHEVLEIKHAGRHAGVSSYTFGTLVKVALEGMFFQTTVLLRWMVYVGFSIGLIGALLAAAVLYSYFVTDPLPGWTSLVVLMLLLGGFFIISMGISALYVGKVFEQVKERPLYVIDRVAGGGATREIEIPATEEVVR
jgi:dolichol-phosphate mannosyltransferase